MTGGARKRFRAPLRWALFWGATLPIGLGFTLVPPSSAGAATIRPSRLASVQIPPGAQDLGSLPPARVVDFEVVLAPTNQAQLQAFLSSLYRPSSASFHDWLSAGAFQSRFGPSQATLEATRSWLRGLGLTVGAPSGDAVSASGPAHLVAAGLGISFERYRTGAGLGFSATSSPVVPADLASRIEGIVGLNTLPAALPHVGRVAASAATTPLARAGVANDPPANCPGATNLAQQEGGYTATSLGSAYGVSTLLSAGLNGSGQRLGVIELATPSSADISNFQSCFGLTNQITSVTVDGGGPSGGAGTSEADVDVEQLAAQSPGASITSYEGPDSDLGEYDAIAKAVSDDTANVISDSWGLCEALKPTSGSGSIASVDVLLEQAAAQGEAVFTAAGDTGSEDCFSSNASRSLAVDYPSSSPWVTAVGGTSRSLNGTEVVWNGCVDVASGSACASGSGAGGGGASSIEARPSWQANLSEPPTASCGGNGTNCREVPDVSADAGVPEAFYVAGSWGLFFGTSVAAPLVAGIWADRDSGCPVADEGNAAPSLYALSETGAYGAGLTDIAQGNNDFTGSNGGQFGAVAGYDLASGLGSVLAPGVACTVVRSLSPAEGPAGTVLTIGGLGLENASISFGGQPLAILSATATSVQVQVPAGSGSVAVTATGPVANAVGSATFTYGPPSGLFTRIYGTTAIDTAVAASEASFPTPGSAGAVVLARSDFFSDALAGGPLAASVGGPVLITEGAGESPSLDPVVEAEIQRVLAPGGTVYILGGDLALSPSIDTTLQRLGYATVRIAGSDEYQTAVLIAEQLGNPSHIFEATGLSFADALSAVPAAVAQHGAILLTDGSTQDPETAAYLAANPSDVRYAIGGPLAAAGADPSATAVFGQDQYGTSAAVAANFFPDPTVVAAATGVNFPDALAAGPSLGLARGPLLLVNPSGPLPAAIAAYLAQVGPGVQKATLFGGPLAVTDAVLAELDGAV